MTRTLLRMAWATSWGGRGPDRQRALLIALAAGALALLGSGLLGAHHLLDRVADRSTARSFALAAPGEPVALRTTVLFDAAPDGRQIYVHWLRLEDPTVTVPGLPADPPEGWYVSPALADRMQRAAELADRFGPATTIAPDGVANADELLAYRVVGPEVGLLDAQVDRRDASQFLADPADLAADDALRFGLLLVLVPLVGLALAAVAPTSVGLDRRLGVLSALGATKAQATAMVALRAAASAAPGALLGAAVWALTAPGRTAVPVVGRPALAGDLVLAPGETVAVAVAAVALVAAVASVRGPSGPGNRPTARLATAPSRLRLVPLATGVAMMVRGSGVIGDPGTRLFLAGVLAAAVGGVAALPLAVARVGDALAAMGEPLALLLGRRLRWNAQAAARSLLAMGVLATFLPLVASHLQLSRDRIDDPAPIASPQPVWVDGPLTLAQQAAVVRDSDAIPITIVQDPVWPSSDTSGPPLLLVADCVELGERVALRRCGPEGFEVAPAAEATFARFRTFDGTEVRPVVGVATAPDGVEVVATAFLGDDWRALDARLRTLADNADVLWPPVGYVVDAKHEAPIARWLYGGITVTLLVVGLTIALHLVAQSARLAGTRGVLHALGTPQVVVRRLAAGESALAVLAAGALAGTIGLIANWCYVQLEPAAHIHFRAVEVLLGVVAATAIAAGSVSWAAVAIDQERAS